MENDKCFFPSGEGDTSGVNFLSYAAIQICEHTDINNIEVEALIDKKMRREMATAAMQGLCANSELNGLTPYRTAQLAVEMADALLKKLYD